MQGSSLQTNALFGKEPKIKMSLQHDIDVSQNFTARVFKLALAILSKNALILSFLQPLQCFHGKMQLGAWGPMVYLQ